MKINKLVISRVIIFSAIMLISSYGFASEQMLTPVTGVIDMLKNTMIYIAIPLCIIAIIGCGLGTAFMGLDKEWLIRSLIGTAIVVGASTIVTIVKAVSGGY